MKTLKLNKETIEVLQTNQLQNVVGGNQSNDPCMESNPRDCDMDVDDTVFSCETQCFDCTMTATC